jgi:hypothetical protein
MSNTVTYVRMLDADAEGADWREVARIVLHLDPDREPDAAGLLARAKWMTREGYRHCFAAAGPALEPDDPVSHERGNVRKLPCSTNAITLLFWRDQ